MLQSIVKFWRSRNHPVLFVAGLAVLSVFAIAISQLDRTNSSIKPVSSRAVVKSAASSNPKTSTTSTKDTNQNADNSGAAVLPGYHQTDAGASSVPATSSQPAPTPATSPGSNTVPSTISVSLSVNSVFKGYVTLSSGSNQCDVLTEALNDGLISSLNMRYSTQYKTEAVYQIDGIGDSNQVWWGYTVNSKSPPQGCSYIAAKNGDSVNWDYAK